MLSAFVAIIPLVGKLYESGESNRENLALVFLSCLLMIVSLFVRSDEIKTSNRERALQDSLWQAKSNIDSGRFTIDTINYNKQITTLQKKNETDSLRYLNTIGQLRLQYANQLLTLRRVNKGIEVGQKTLDVTTAGQTIPRIDINTRPRLRPNESAGWTLGFILYNPGPNPVNNVYVLLRQRFRTPFKEQIVLYQGKASDVLSVNPLDTFSSPGSVWLNEQNSLPLGQIDIPDEDSALYFRATITHQFDVVEQTTIFRRVKLENSGRGFFWRKAVRIESTRLRKVVEIVDPEFPETKVDWGTGWR